MKFEIQPPIRPGIIQYRKFLSKNQLKAELVIQ